MDQLVVYGHPKRRQSLGETTGSSRPLLLAWAPFSPTLVEVGSLVGGRVVFLNILFGKKLAAPLRYGLLALRTLAVLGKEQPKIVLAQNPPIFLPLLLVMAGPLRRFRLIVDHHAVWSMKTLRQPLLSQAIAVLEAFVSKRADANMSPNNNWTRELRARGATDAFTYHDFIPKPPTTAEKSVEWTTHPLPPHRFLVIAAHGGHPQELLEDEVAAVSGFQDYLLVITGKREKLGHRMGRLNLKSNVIYPGYLDDAQYEALKKSADVALSLSTELNTVPHAIHEYLAYGIPTIVLKDTLLRSLFDGAILEIDDSRPETVQAALKRATQDSAFLADLRKNINRNYEQRSKTYRDEVSKLRQVLTS